VDASPLARAKGKDSSGANTTEQLLARVGRGVRERRTEAPTQYMLCACSRPRGVTAKRTRSPLQCKIVQTPCADKTVIPTVACPSH
jgi:hypothetical protein